MIHTPETLKTRNGLIQMIRIDTFTCQKRVEYFMMHVLKWVPKLELSPNNILVLEFERIQTNLVVVVVVVVPFA